MRQPETLLELWQRIKNTPSIWLTWLLMLGGFIYFSDEILDGLFPYRHSPDFKTIKINSKIKAILYYNRGIPVVTLSDGRSLLLKVPGSGKKYVQVGDSIVKKPQSDSVSVYRKYPSHTEVRVYGHGRNYGANDLDYPYSALQERKRVSEQK